MINLINTANAQNFSGVLSKNPTLYSIFEKISDNIIAPIVEVLFLLAFVTFVYGMFKMISSADDSGGRKDGQNAILWGVIGMVIMVSVFGLVRLIGYTVGVGDPFS